MQAEATGESPSGKASDFDSDIRRFDPCLPCQDESSCHPDRIATATVSGGWLKKRVIPITRFLFLLIRVNGPVLFVLHPVWPECGSGAGLQPEVLVRIANAGCKGGLR